MPASVLWNARRLFLKLKIIPKSIDILLLILYN